MIENKKPNQLSEPSSLMSALQDCPDPISRQVALSSASTRSGSKVKRRIGDILSKASTGHIAFVSQLSLADAFDEERLLNEVVLDGEDGLPAAYTFVV